MEKDINGESIEKIIEKINGQAANESNVSESAVSEGLVFEYDSSDDDRETASEAPALSEETAVAETEEQDSADETADPREEQEPASEPSAEEETVNGAESVVWHTYVPRFTEASENYRMQGDARIRAMLKGKNSSSVEKIENNSDEIRFDATAEFEEDIVGAPARAPENRAVDESEESLNLYKFSGEEEYMEEINGRTAEQEREEIEKLLRTEPKPEPKAEFIPEPAVEAEEPKEETIPEAEAIPETEQEKEYAIPDPESEDMGVFDFSVKASATEEPEDIPQGVEAPAAPSVKGKLKDTEFINPVQRDGFKDRFLDSLISIRIRFGAALLFTLALLVVEVLSATKVIPYKLFEGSSFSFALGLVDFLLAACVFVIALPEIIRSVKHLFSKKLMPDFLPLPAFLMLALYTLTLVLTSAAAYSLFGFLFALITLPVICAALYRTKADFIAFKMISRPEEKQIIDKKNTREFGAENIALDGIVDEYKSKTARTFRASFISDFFKNSANATVVCGHTGVLLSIPFAIGLVAGVVAYFLSWSFVTAMEVFSLTVMLGFPGFAILANKITFFHSQRAALLTDSTAVGEDAYHNYSSVDVFAFDDTDIFGPDDVNLKRFMLYGERDSMEKVMRQMSALFSAAGGPLDYMFSNVIDNRVRHKSATNLIIEDDGICGDVSGHKVCAGSEDYMRRNGIAIPSGAVGSESVIGIDTTKIMYAAEDGEVYAKFYIRYSFSEEFTAILPSLREAGVIPLIYTRDPNVSGELLMTLTAGSDCMRVVKMYNPLPREEKVFGRVSASMVTYGDRIDAAGMIVLAKKYKDLSLRVRFAELCAMGIGVLLAILISAFGLSRASVLVASVWQIVWCFALYLISKTNFLKENKKEEE